MLTLWEPHYRVPTFLYLQKKVQFMSIHWAEIVHGGPLPPAT